MLTIPKKLSLEDTIAYLEQMRKYHAVRAEQESSPTASDLLKSLCKADADVASEYAQLCQWLTEYKQMKMRKTTSALDNVDVYD